MSQGYVVIVNLTDQNWTIHRSYGTYQVRGRTPEEPYALIPVAGTRAVTDLGRLPPQRKMVRPRRRHRSPSRSLS